MSPSAPRSPLPAPLRLGRIGYVNCYPVYGAIDRGIVAPPAELVTGTPSELNDLLAAGELDLSVVSAVEYARNAAAYHLLPDLAVSSDGPVQSVCLFSRRPAEELDRGTILLSASSRTSVFLVQLLCQDLWHVRPRFAEARAEAADLDSVAGLPHDAVLIIGDSALVLAGRGTYPHKYDLGEVWKRWTGLPFVFAVWAARREADHDQVQRVHGGLLESRAWGLANLDELAAQASRVTGVSLPACLEYLSGLDYGLGYKELEGLTGFLRRLAARGMVREGALAFLSVA
jgi:chorismate dehydratase